MDARAHALTASNLLHALDERSKEISELSDDDRVQLEAMGVARTLNATLDWTLQLATGHALAALALAHTEGGKR